MDYRKLSMESPVILYGNECNAVGGERLWQGVPAICTLENGNTYVAFFSGGADEGHGNYVVLLESKDGGKTFSETPALCIFPKTLPTRCFDPGLWVDPLGRMWLFWTQACQPEGRGAFDKRLGLWTLRFDAPMECLQPSSPPKRICDGGMINKPTVLNNGAWLFPVSSFDHLDMPAGQTPKTTVYRTTDMGETILPDSVAEIPQRDFDEAMIVELVELVEKGGLAPLWMLARTTYGISESFSYDGGKTWSKGQDSRIKGPCSRFHIRRLKSGRLLMVNHYNFINEGYEQFAQKNNWAENFHIKWALRRRNLAALISEDDGKTWPYSLMLDRRERVSYPDCAETADGRILIVYDFDRYGEAQFLLSSITEEDILAGKLVTDNSYMARCITELGLRGNQP